MRARSGGGILLRFVIEGEEEEGDGDARVGSPVAEGVLDGGGT